MGKSSSKNCLPISGFDARKNSNFYELAPTASFSNPSLETLSTVESIIETSPSMQFTPEYMENLYTQYKLDNDLESKLSYNVVRIVSSIVEYLSLEEHILFLANKFFQRFYNDDPVYMTVFSNCIMFNDITPPFENKSYVLEHHMILHSMFYFRIQKFILTTLDDGKEDRAYEILSLIALSHLIMKVDYKYFEQQSRKLIQVIIHLNLISDDQLPAFVYYQVTMLRYIGEMMIKYKERNENLYKGITDQNSPARDNYRELKKWRIIVMTIKKTLSKPIAQFDKQIEEEKRRTRAMSLEEDDEKWNIIRRLKKGYKYRSKVQQNAALETKE